MNSRVSGQYVTYYDVLPGFLTNNHHVNLCVRCFLLCLSDFNLKLVFNKCQASLLDCLFAIELFNNN